ncbi:hypothetical protein ACXWOQ_10100, partial [Streptococcus pyogenes]
LLLSLEKRDNPFFDPRFIRNIYTMTGILKPTIMLDGQLVATWRKEKGVTYIKPFSQMKVADKKIILQTAEEKHPKVAF